MNGRPQEAVALFERSVAVDPRYGMALEHLGLAHLMVGRFTDAERILRQAATLPGAP
ncbi:MAG: tetratricopeptide repeat protein, partial [Betaproteobacteria bacterium]